MTVDHTFVIEKIKNLECVYVVYTQATNMPLVTCDEETFNDQVWMFATSEQLEEFTKTYTKQGMTTKCVEIKKAERLVFFTELHVMGVNEVVFCDKEAEYKIDLNHIATLPDYSKIPADKRPVMNPELLLSTVYFFQEVKKDGVDPSSEKLHNLAEEMYVNLVKARFIVPMEASVNPMNKKKEARLIFMKDKQGKKMLPVFSDIIEYNKHIRKYGASKNLCAGVSTFQDVLKILNNDFSGIILNPHGYCHVLNKEQLAFVSQTFLKRK